ncbi:hypothetical protein ON010_g804 [Phytophthora cinnamomi]|nr:hypothetical protein ON010_g804 [Phytophthora cinnamomi]
MFRAGLVTSGARYSPCSTAGLVGGLGALDVALVGRVGLARQAQHALPRAAEGVHAARRVARDGLDREVHNAVGAQAHGETGVAGHGAVHGVLAQQHAVQTVGGVGRHRADHVRRVNVLDGALLALLGKVLLDAVLHEGTDGRQLLVATGVSFHRRAQQLLAGALGDDDHTVTLLLHNALKVVQAAARAIKLDRDLRDQTQVDIAAGKRRVGSDEAGATAHKLDNTNAVGHAASLRASRADSALGLLDGRVEAEAAVQQVHVVIDSLGDTGDRDRQVAATALLRDLVGGTVGAVTADHVHLRDAVRGQEVDDLVLVEATTVGAEDGAAVVVDAGHRLGGQHDGGLLLVQRGPVVEAGEAHADTVDLALQR